VLTRLLLPGFRGPQETAGPYTYASLPDFLFGPVPLMICRRGRRQQREVGNPGPETPVDDKGRAVTNLTVCEPDRDLLRPVRLADYGLSVSSLL
jgi:hypothetical protein